MGGGPGVESGGGRCEDVSRGVVEQSCRPVFPVEGIEGEDADKDGVEISCIPCGEEEQAEMPLCLPSVYQPTRSEYLDHCVTHYPFRAWCKHCLEGRGREFGHDNQRGLKDERSTPVVSFDYCFISDAGDITTDVEFEAAGDGAAKILVVRDSKSKAVFAHVVTMKGVDEKGFAVSALAGNVKWLRYITRLC